jgi:hypothetical protein
MALQALALAIPTAALGNGPVTDSIADLDFASFYRRPVGPAGLQFSDRLRALDGRQVRLVGHMVVQEAAVPGRFLLSPVPMRLSEHADGDAVDLPPSTVTVMLDPTHADRRIHPLPGALALIGRLDLGRQEGPDGKVSWIRLHLAPEALEDRQSAASPDALHRHGP